jgi:hypothetical protein
MLDFKNVELSDKEVFDKYYSEYNPDISEMTFTNVFMWRKAFGYQYSIINDMLCCIAFSKYIKPFALTPIGIFKKDSFREVVYKLKEFFEENKFDLFFKRVSKRGLEQFNTAFKENEIITELNRDDFDYVYKIDALSTLKGKKYHKKRNHINKFLKTHKSGYEYVKLNDENLNNAYRILNEWCSKRNCDDHRVYGCERLANFEVLKNLKKLGCKGALIRVNGRFEAVTVGEQLNDNSVVIHIEKADSEIDGLYNLINRDFLKNEWSNLEYVNREQDLGVEGLRKAKLSYHPDYLIDKSIVKVK